MPNPGYLEGIRQLCDIYSSVLIFDEVQTGLRVGLKGAQGLLGVIPDLTCMGKALSAGYPVSAVGGRASIMELIADRRVLQAGTYNSNPVGLAALVANLKVLSQPGHYEHMTQLSQRLRKKLGEIIAPLGGYIQGATTVFGLAFGPGPIMNMREGWRNNIDDIMKFKLELRMRGVYTKPTPRDIWYVSIVHTDADVDSTLLAAADAADAMNLNSQK